MMSGQQIAALSQQAARKAAKARKVPYMVWPEDLTAWTAAIDSGRYPSLPFPFLGSYVPKGYEKTDEFFVDASGFGAPGEPALTIPEFVRKIKADRAYAIAEAGQFQVYIYEFEKTRKAA